MRRSAFILAFIIGLWGATMHSVSHAMQGPARADEIVVLEPKNPPEGGLWNANDKLDEIEFHDEQLRSVLQTFASCWGLKVTAPKRALDRTVSFHLKKVTYQQIISHIFRDTEFEPVFQHPNVTIGFKKPNKALVPTTTAVTPAADAPVAPAAVAAHL